MSSDPPSALWTGEVAELARSETLDELEWKGVHRVEFIALCDELDFGGIPNRPTRWLG